MTLGREPALPGSGLSGGIGSAGLLDWLESGVPHPAGTLLGWFSQWKPMLSGSQVGLFPVH